VAAVVVRAVVASIIVFPRPEDTAYYVGVARNLLDGDGLVSNALWSYGTPPLVFPRPAFEVWLPLPTFLAAIPMALFGPSFAAAQVSSVIVGATVPVLAWRLALDVAKERELPLGRARTLAVGTGLTAAIYLPLVLHSALPDSTMPFAALALGACLLMHRLAADPGGARYLDLRLIGLGGLLGLAAWTRNEAAWLALTWVIVAWSIPYLRRPEFVRLIAVPAIVAIVVFAPWAARDWAVFGSPFPGQALTNALSISGLDIFAWNDPPTLDRYLAIGPQRLLELRVEGVLHNLFNVLLYLGIPVSAVGLVALPWFGRGRALRPLLIVSVLTFLVTSLVFPVATTWGTFLHAAGPAHVLLIVSCLLALDAGIARVGRRRGWTNPVAWLGPALTIFGCLLFSVALLPVFGSDARATRDHYADLGTRLEAAGVRLGPGGDRVLTDFPIWFAETTGTESLALPNESARDVLILAQALGGTVVVVERDGLDDHRWPGVIDAGEIGASCFEELSLDPPQGAETPSVTDGTRAFRVVCP
jgi:hypothetical protein